MNIWAGVTIGLAALGVAGYKISRLSKDAGNIDFDVKGRLHKLTFTSVVFAIDAIIKNPTQIKVHILQPYVQIFHKDKQIASSAVSDKIIPVAPFSPAPLETMMITASYMNLSDLAAELIKKLSDKDKKITVQVKLLVNLVKNLEGEIPTNLRDYKASTPKIIPLTITKEMTF